MYNVLIQSKIVAQIRENSGDLGTIKTTEIWAQYIKMMHKEAEVIFLTIFQLNSVVNDKSKVRF